MLLSRIAEEDIARIELVSWQKHTVSVPSTRVALYQEALDGAYVYKKDNGTGPTAAHQIPIIIRAYISRRASEVVLAIGVTHGSIFFVDADVLFTLVPCTEQSVNGRQH